MTHSQTLIALYALFLGFSAFLTGLYIFKWHKHYDVHITLVYVLVPIVNLSYFLYSTAEDLGAAVSAIKFSYLGGCYLIMIIMLVVLSLCGFHLNRWLKFFFYLLSTAVFLSTLTIGKLPIFYSNVRLEFKDGLPVLVKQYGFMHNAFYAISLFYFTVSICAILYCYVKKNQVSRTILVLLMIPEIVCMFSYFVGRKITGSYILISISFVFAQISYLILISQISLYDVSDAAIDSLVRTGDTGFFSFDLHYHYLTSNETAKVVLPDLKKLTVDRTIDLVPSIRDTVRPWLEAFRQDETCNTQHYEKGEQVFLITVTWLYNGKKKAGYQLTVTDDTQDQKYIRLLNNYNTELESEVAAKSAHIEEMHDNLILSMATMVESRDNSTGGHIRRTSEGVRILLAHMDNGDGFECSESFRKNLIKAAPMHDLGKIAVDDEVLRKPGRFTPEEFEKMKAHAAEGYRIVHEILKGTDDEAFRRIAENVAHFHHERWDGSGYPEGLKGEKIPREARIMAIADVYDALVSKRVYKDKMSFEKAHSIMMEGMGSQFAPEMKSVYLKAKPFLEEYYTSLEEQDS